MLNPEIFEEIDKIYGTCDIDLFASRDNKQISTYVSYSPDKHATAVDLLQFHGVNLSVIFSLVSVFSAGCSKR